MLLQVDLVELGNHEVTFHGHFQGSSVDQYQGINSLRQGDLSHYQYLNGTIYPLSKNQQEAYII